MNALPDDIMADAMAAAERAFMIRLAEAFPLRASQQSALGASCRAAVDAALLVIGPHMVAAALHDVAGEIIAAWTDRNLP